MIEPSDSIVSENILKQAFASMPSDISKLTINTPTGNFFYDPWVIRSEFKNTVWEEILNSIPDDQIGEARIINLNIKSCYTKHADIDDRWHLAFEEGDSFLIDLESNTMYQTEYSCHECGSTCVKTFDRHWHQCPLCSPISRDKPPDFQPARASH